MVPEVLHCVAMKAAAAPKRPKLAAASDGNAGPSGDAGAGDSAATRRRWVTSVDLGELRPEVERACASAGVGASTWLKALVARELAKTAPGTTTESDPADDPADGSVYRARLSARLTAKLDERRLRDGFRSRAAVLRALIDGVGLTRGDGVDAVASSSRPVDGDRPASLREAVDALGDSTFRLVTIGLNVNQIFKSLKAVPGSTTLAERKALGQASAEILKHIKQASDLVGQLRPMLKRLPSDAPHDAGPRPPRPERTQR